MNLILNTDSYKLSHHLQLPPGVTHTSSYGTARGGADEIVYFGMQPFIKEYLTKPITRENIAEAEAIATAHGLPFNKRGWEQILDTHGGYLPLEIEGLSEGSVVPVQTPVFQVVNTDPRFPWLTSYIETALLRAIWYPSSVATISRGVRKLLKEYYDRYCPDAVDQLDFKLHDFGARGASSEETAALGGMAHLINFKGTDTISGLIAARTYYGEDMAGFSIPAAEHSTITSWGKENENQAFANMVNTFGGEGKIYAVVSDSYDIYGACEKLWGEELRDLVLAKGGQLVVRPDSGNPAEVVLQCLAILGAKFGTTENVRGMKVLHPAVRVIQGDGVNPVSIKEILNRMIWAGWSPENVAFGMGGALLQKVDRDTFKWAMKVNAVCKDGKWMDVYKDPVTDKGKKSLRGRLAVEEGFKTVRIGHATSNLLKPVFRNGENLSHETFSAIRERAKI